MTGLHGRQYTKHEARVHWICRLVDRCALTADDRLILYLGLFALGFTVGMLIFGGHG